MSAKKEKALVTKQDSLAAVNDLSEFSGAIANPADGYDGKDLLIQKILLMQGLSVMVAAGKGSPGEMLSSVDQSKLAGKDDKIEVIPLHAYKTWKISKQEGNKWKWVTREPVTPSNTDRAREWEEGGQKLRADLERNVYVMLKSNITDPEAMPYLITFTRSGSKAGQSMYTHIMNCARANAPAFAKSVILSSLHTKNANGDQFYVFNVTNDGNKSSREEMVQAMGWFDTIKGGAIKVDENAEDEADESAVGSSAPANAHKF